LTDDAFDVETMKYENFYFEVSDWWKIKFTAEVQEVRVQTSTFDVGNSVV